MSSSTWSVAAVKATLLELLDATGWPGAKPQLSWGVPRTLERETVIVGGTTNGDEEWSALGNLRRTEDYRLQLWVTVQHPASQQAATERAVELYGVVETVARANPNMQGALPAGQWCEIRSPQLLEGPAPEAGWVAEIEFEIRVRARK